jgi:hypothetical protein
MDGWGMCFCGHVAPDGGTHFTHFIQTSSVVCCRCGILPPGFILGDNVIATGTNLGNPCALMPPVPPPGPPPASQASVLLKAREEMGNPAPLSSWNSSDPCTPPGWVYIKCRNGQVNQITAGTKLVSGKPLPGNLSSLASLAVIILR